MKYIQKHKIFRSLLFTVIGYCTRIFCKSDKEDGTLVGDGNVVIFALIVFYLQ